MLYLKRNVLENITSIEIFRIPGGPAFIFALVQIVLYVDCETSIKQT